MMSTLSPEFPLKKPASSREVWRRAFNLPDGCVTNADGDLSDEDAADRCGYHRGTVTLLVSR
jgi:hypothetical protein